MYAHDFSIILALWRGNAFFAALQLPHLKYRIMTISITKKLPEDAKSLSIEDRLQIIDELLRSLNPQIPEIEAEWAKIAQKRLAELHSKGVIPISGEEVFKKVKERFA